MWQCASVCLSVKNELKRQYYAVFLLQKDIMYIKWVSTVSKVQDDDVFFRCWCLFRVLLPFSGVEAMFVWLFNVWVCMQCWGVYAMFVWVLMQCPGVYAKFMCWCNVRVLMHGSSLDAMFGCLCNILVLMQCSFSC